MIGWGLADFFAKRTIDLIGDLPTLLWGHVLGAISITTVGLVYVLASGAATDLPTRAIEWLGLVLFGAGQAGVYLLVYRAFSKGPVSLLSPIFASYSGIAALLSVIFGEAIGAPTVLVLVVMFAGVMIASLEGGRAVRRSFSQACRRHCWVQALPQGGPLVGAALCTVTAGLLTR